MHGHHAEFLLSLMHVTVHAVDHKFQASKVIVIATTGKYLYFCEVRKCTEHVAIKFSLPGLHLILHLELNESYSTGHSHAPTLCIGKVKFPVVKAAGNLQKILNKK